MLLAGKQKGDLACKQSVGTAGFPLQAQLNQY